VIRTGLRMTHSFARRTFTSSLKAVKHCVLRLKDRVTNPTHRRPGGYREKEAVYEVL